MLDLIPTFGGLPLPVTIVIFVVALSIIVTVHEYGHYIVGRWCGIHAEVFSVGFGPVLASRVDKHGTKWQIAAVPLGGYVKFLGDADAASATADEGFLDRIVDTEREKELRRSMLGAPLWARSATVAAGPVFNFILSAVILTGVYLNTGSAIEPPTVGQLVALPAETQELREGDQIVAIEGQETLDYEALYTVISEIEITPQIDYTIVRDGRETVVQGPWLFPVVIGHVQPGSAAIDAGLSVGDVIVSVDGQELTAFKELQDVVLASEGRDLALQVWRDGETRQVTLAPRYTDIPLPDGGFETRLLMGLSGDLLFQPETEAIGPLTAVSRAGQQVWQQAKTTVSMLLHIISGDISTCNLRGPVGIAEASAEMASQGLQDFILLIAALSTAVGLLNLFPIPVLDGGHLVFHAYEAIARRPPSETALKYLMAGGLLIILSLMVFALTNDLVLCP